MNLDQALSYLSEAPSTGLDEPQIDSVRVILRTLKAEAVVAGDQELAKQLWCYEQILRIQCDYLKSFQQMKGAQYYDAWCTLEQVEIKIGFLEKHFNISINNDLFKVSFIKTQVERFQALYPYRLFSSPGMLVIEKRCSICNAVITLRSDCGHLPGEIYDGEMCGREITDAQLLEVSLVTRPFKKSAVMFIIDQQSGRSKDQYDYSLVNYVVRGLQDPFHGWSADWTTTRHPHSKYKNLGRNDTCPCESRKKYKNCCLRESGVLRPHLNITFEVAPPPDMPAIEYTY